MILKAQQAHASKNTYDDVCFSKMHNVWGSCNHPFVNFYGAPRVGWLLTYGITVSQMIADICS